MDSALKEYIAKVEAWMEENRIEMPPQQHGRGKNRLQGAQRWDMLVSKIVLDMTDEKIGAKYGAEFGFTKQAAADHIKALAARLGVTLPVRQPSRRR